MEILSIPITRKPRNYWTLENTIKELKGIIEAGFCYQGDLIKNLRLHKRYGLVAAIFKHGGLRRLNKKFNLGLLLRKAYWSKKEILCELEMLSDKGIVINQANLARLDRNDLLGAVYKFGGLNILKSKLGLTVTRQNYWSDKKIITALKPIVSDFGRIPSAHILKTIGKSDLASAIKKKGGVKKFSRLLNVSNNAYFESNDKHYLNSSYECLFDNILHKYYVAHSVNERISPTTTFRYDFLIGDTYIEICGYNRKEHPAYFKRLAMKEKLYKKLNLKYILIEKSFFNDKFPIVEEKIIKLVAGHLPTASFKRRQVYQDIRPPHYYKNFKNVKKELLPLVKKYGRMLLDRELRKEKKYSLVHGIYKFHRNFYEVAKKLRIKIMYKPKGFYIQESAIKEYRQLCKKHQRFLTQSELQQMGCFGLLGCIAKNGGLIQFRKLVKLKYKAIYLPRGYYTPEKAQDAYKQLCLVKKRFISSKELVRLGAGPLAAYIQKTGGYYKIRNEAGLDFPPLRKLQQY